MNRILIIENNPANMKLVVTVLNNSGHRILQAGNARNVHPVG